MFPSHDRLEALEAAFRTPRGDLLITFSGDAWIDLKHSDNSALNVDARFIKAGGDYDTGTSRKYTLTIEGQMPADLAGQSGRQSSNVKISTDSSGIRTVTISGVYTAIAGNTALAQHDANVATYTTAVITALGGTFELVEPITVDHDDANDIANFTRTFREVIFNQSAGTLDDPEIKSQSIVVSASTTAPGDSPLGTQIAQEIGAPLKTSGSVLRPVQLTVQANMHVDKDQTTDLRGLWEGKLRSHLRNVALSYANGTAYITEERPTFDPHRS